MPGRNKVAADKLSCSLVEGLEHVPGDLKRSRVAKFAAFRDGLRWLGFDELNGPPIDGAIECGPAQTRGFFLSSVMFKRQTWGERLLGDLAGIGFEEEGT